MKICSRGGSTAKRHDSFNGEASHQFEPTNSLKLQRSGLSVERSYEGSFDPRSGDLYKSKKIAPTGGVLSG